MSNKLLGDWGTYYTWSNQAAELFRCKALRIKILLDRYKKFFEVVESMSLGVHFYTSHDNINNSFKNILLVFISLQNLGKLFL